MGFSLILGSVSLIFYLRSYFLESSYIFDQKMYFIACVLQSSRCTANICWVRPSMCIRNHPSQKKWKRHVECNHISLFLFCFLSSFSWTWRIELCAIFDFFRSCFIKLRSSTTIFFDIIYNPERKLTFIIVKVILYTIISVCSCNIENQ